MVSLLKVPAPVKELFDKFPVEQYPAVKQLTPDTKKEIVNRNYSFSVSSDDKTNGLVTFKLGTYNVYHLDDNTVLATDPLCLIAELALSIKNNIKLPKLNNDKSDSNRNSLFLLSHHANSQGFLPIYVEEENHKKSNRLIKDSQSIDEILLSRVQSSSELMLITLVDNVVYDFWITSVLFEFSKEVQQEIFTFSTSSQQHYVNSWGIDTLLSQLLTRNAFDLRNPAITKQYQNDPYSILTKRLPKYGKAVDFEKERNGKEFAHAMENLNSILVKRGTTFFNGDSKPGLLDVKIASYITLVQKYGPGTVIYDVVQRYESLVKHADSVIQFCS
ncbi:Sorting assembly machinery [Wickerhamomyces ciferrii]|uniref:Sorting assembly machinery n=1 Tax=Wickerhamomyces ciferrii (strain ATCC 14091 / BCRC 22168 / CBS 111 / JCM 3599 / NBRC 0793 / NRRL Y-1031 F-60-10) TaxID=1206466 RepID=K0KFY5_WICCF|nr:Sorting assembly machinery [Wickerhamomyces ciferrii]CCH44070.1 Sorting assembly machinery [Wickerhamomyces ciferrii]